jgi:hypothetical protein
VKRSAAVVMMVLALGLAPPALAEDGPTLNVYGGQAGVVQASVAKQGGPPSAGPASSSTGTLPFTGVELGLFALVGGALVGSGVGLRRLTSTNEA